MRRDRIKAIFEENPEPQESAETLETQEEYDEELELQHGMQMRLEYNRNRNQKCLNCRFWEFDDVRRKGFCHRYPPQVKDDEVNRMNAWGFPEMTYEKWCGEWQPIPKKDGYYAVATPIDDERFTDESNT